MSTASFRTASSLLLSAIVLVGTMGSVWGEDKFTANAYVMAQASSVIGPAGGVVEVSNAASPLYGSKVVFPAGAVSSPTRVSINRVTSGSGYPGDVLVTDIEPYNLKLAAPATVTLKYSPQYLYDNQIEDASGMRVLSRDARDPVIPDEMLSPLSHDTSTHALAINTTSLGTFVPLSFSNTTLNGAYAVAGVAFKRTTTQSATPAMGAALPTPKGFKSGWATSTFNGAGSFTSTQSNNQDGSITSKSQTQSYTVSSTGAFTIVNGGASGQVLSGGSVVIAGSTDATSPGMFVFIKKGGTFSNASLNGAYAVAGAAFKRTTTQSATPAMGAALPTPKGFKSGWGTSTFNGAGSFTSTQSNNQDGSITSKQQTQSYTVSSTGAFTIVNGGISGQVLSGGNVIIASSTDVTSPGIFVFIKKGGTFSNASLNGAYAVAQIAFKRTTTQSATPAMGAALPTPKGFKSGSGTATFNGAGGLTLNSSNNQDGSISSKSQAESYTVSSTGAFSIVGGGISGQVLNGGNVIIAGSTDATSPGILVFIKG